MVVSSERHPAHVEQAVTTFLDNALADVKALSSDEFNDHVQSVSMELREAPNNIQEQTDYHWRCVCDKQGNFYERYLVRGQSQCDVLTAVPLFRAGAAKELMHVQVDAELQHITHADLVSFYANYIESSGERYRKLVVAAVSSAHKQETWELNTGGQAISDVAAVKAALPLSRPIV